MDDGDWRGLALDRVLLAAVGLVHLLDKVGGDGLRDVAVVGVVLVAMVEWIDRVRLLLLAYRLAARAKVGGLTWGRCMRSGPADWGSMPDPWAGSDAGGACWSTSGRRPTGEGESRVVMGGGGRVEGAAFEFADVDEAGVGRVGLGDKGGGHVHAKGHGLMRACACRLLLIQINERWGR